MRNRPQSGSNDETARLKRRVAELETQLSEREKAELKLRQSSAQVRQLVEHIGEVLWICNMQDYRTI